MYDPISPVPAPGVSFPSVSGLGDVRSLKHVPATPSGLVVFFHGIGGHGDTRQVRQLASACLARGLAFYAWDCPHHGRSSTLGDPDSRMRPLHVVRGDEYLPSDACTFVARAIAEHPELPFVLCGQSFGGGLLLRCAGDLQSSTFARCRGLLLLSPMCEDANVRLFRRCPLLGCLRGKWCLLRFALRYVRRLSRTERAALRADPLIAARLPSLATMGTCARLVLATQPERIRQPLVIAQGGRDDLIPIDGMLDALARAATPPLERVLHLSPSGGHDLLHEASAADEYAALCVDLLRRAPSTV